MALFTPPGSGQSEWIKVPVPQPVAPRQAPQQAPAPQPAPQQQAAPQGQQAAPATPQQQQGVRAFVLPAGAMKRGRKQMQRPRLYAEPTRAAIGGKSVHPAIAGSRLAFHLKQLVGQYGGRHPIGDLASRALAGDTKVYSHLGQQLAKAGHELGDKGTYNWAKVGEGVALDGLVRSFAGKAFKGGQPDLYQKFAKQFAGPQDTVTHNGKIYVLDKMHPKKQAVWDAIRAHVNRPGTGKRYTDHEIVQSIRRQAAKEQDAAKMPGDSQRVPEKGKTVKFDQVPLRKPQEVGSTSRSWSNYMGLAPARGTAEAYKRRYALGMHEATDDEHPIWGRYPYSHVLRAIADSVPGKAGTAADTLLYHPYFNGGVGKLAGMIPGLRTPVGHVIEHVILHGVAGVSPEDAGKFAASLEPFLRRSNLAESMVGREQPRPNPSGEGDTRPGKFSRSSIEAYKRRYAILGGLFGKKGIPETTGFRREGDAPFNVGTNRKTGEALDNWTPAFAERSALHSYLQGQGLAPWAGDPGRTHAVVQSFVNRIADHMIRNNNHPDVVAYHHAALTPAEVGVNKLRHKVEPLVNAVMTDPEREAAGRFHAERARREAEARRGADLDRPPIDLAQFEPPPSYALPDQEEFTHPTIPAHHGQPPLKKPRGNALPTQFPVVPHPTTPETPPLPMASGRKADVAKAELKKSMDEHLAALQARGVHRDEIKAAMRRHLESTLVKATPRQIAATVAGFVRRRNLSRLRNSVRRLARRYNGRDALRLAIREVYADARQG